MTQPQPSTISCPLTPTSIDMSARAATATATTLPNLLTRIFTSLSHNNRRWSLRRTLQSDNPLDINGELRGTATFTPLRARNDTETKPNPLEMVYREEGELPNTSTFGSGLRWTKKYIWQQQQGSQGHISVWFVKVKPHVARRIPVTDSNSNTTTEQETTEEEDEADYLFHEFDFGVEGGEEGEAFVVPPEPPAVATEGKGDGEGEGEEETDVVVARGNHLCINDMYRTAYAFRIRRESGEVVSWSSRHVVKGPKKNQDIVNLYRIEE